MDNKDNNTDKSVEETKFLNKNNSNTISDLGKGLAHGMRLGQSKKDMSNVNKNNPAKGQNISTNNSLNNNESNNINYKTNPLLGGGTNKKDDKLEKNLKINNKESVINSTEKNSFMKRKSFTLPKLNLRLNKEEKSENSVTSRSLNETNDTGISKIMSKFPIQVMFVVIIAASVLFVLFLIIAVFFGSITGTNSNTSSSDIYCGSSDYDLSVLDSNPPSYTYTDVFNVAWSKSTAQFETLSGLKTYADEDGFLRSGDAYFIALGSYFGIDVDGEKKLVMGTKYVIKLKDGTEFIGILADAKSDAHTTESSQHSQHIYDKSVIEFEMACGSKINPKSYGFNFSGSYNTSCSGAQSAINKKFSGKIKSISLLDDSGTSCVYENGEFPIRTEYFSSSDVSKILNAAPGANGNYNTPNLRYQCVTYAKLRAVEILLTATNVSDEYKNKAISAISGTQGNGWKWSARDNPNLKSFNFDSTCDNPKAGSLIAWNGNGTVCSSGNSPTGYCGHVGIIEAVDYNKKTVIMTDGYTNSHFNYHKNMSFSQLKSSYGGCRAITYLFEYQG